MASDVRKNQVAKKIDKIASNCLVIVYIFGLLLLILGIFSLIAGGGYDDEVLSASFVLIIYGVVFLVVGTITYYLIKGFTEIIELLDKISKK